MSPFLASSDWLLPTTTRASAYLAPALTAPSTAASAMSNIRRTLAGWSATPRPSRRTPIPRGFGQLDDRISVIWLPGTPGGRAGCRADRSRPEPPRSASTYAAAVRRKAVWITVAVVVVLAGALVGLSYLLKTTRTDILTVTEPLSALDAATGSGAITIGPSSGAARVAR